LNGKEIIYNNKNRLEFFEVLEDIQSILSEKFKEVWINSIN
jgi:hypothetical protein